MSESRPYSNLLAIARSKETQLTTEKVLAGVAKWEQNDQARFLRHGMLTTKDEPNAEPGHIIPNETLSLKREQKYQLPGSEQESILGTDTRMREIQEMPAELKKQLGQNLTRRDIKFEQNIAGLDANSKPLTSEQPQS